MYFTNEKMANFPLVTVIASAKLENLMPNVKKTKTKSSKLRNQIFFMAKLMF